jgi:SAM-dependent methyltransferase
VLRVTATPAHYDSDPDRWASHDPAWQLAGDIHEDVARRIAGDRLSPVLDVGSGNGKLGALLPAGWPAAGIDASATQLRQPGAGPAFQADALALPFASGVFGAVAALWMLYHLDEPLVAIAEAHRVLRPGGIFFACTSSRYNDPELTPSYPVTTFDAEDAPALVAGVFGSSATHVVSWDAPLNRLADRDALVRYLRSHYLPAEIADRVTTPLTLTKRGCLVIAVKQPGQAGHAPVR